VSLFSKYTLDTTRTWVVMNDLQIPFQDQKVLDLVLNFVDDLKPHGVVLNGDIVDCYSISDFAKNPASEADLKKEIHESSQLMDRLAKVTSERVWLGGNHEDRLRRLNWKNVPALAATGKLDFPVIFETSEHGFDYKPYGEVEYLGRLMVTHGDKAMKHSGQTAKAAFEQTGSSIMVGHTHRLGTYYKTDSNGIHASWENGCLCLMNPEYVQRPNWQQGFSVVHVDHTGFYSVQQIPILDGASFFYGGTRVGKANLRLVSKRKAA
jgi:predicted phosphodiesterase